MQALKRRFVDHASTRHVRYTQAIVNHGHEAGASLSHPHGQLLGLPFVPGEVLDEERAFARFVGGCVLCTTVEAEISAGERIIFANDDVVVMCPYWSGSPYELLFVPRRHELHLQDADDDSLDAIGRALRDATAFLNEALGDIAYNVGFHTAPHQHGGRVPLARPPVAEPPHDRRLRARHRRPDQRGAARAGRRGAARGRRA